ncbi:MaoC/PaaZ C-terminal domain-containing protein [Lentibacillus jeotgali]|uniref:MaoC/PaaZ C-terminal domain-containing protein n=1 Tax=Lentibacillus jeotgali TaxID=558169 RepID=UPI0002627461|nr:MaoC/PaaZ C-terminal domain-containing protein [Lentibacillus jeotgali]
MFDKYLEEYEINESWTSRGRTITESDLVMFSAFSGDWFPLHTDEEYAKKTQYNQRIAHGMLVLSVATGLLHFEPEIVFAFYGMEKVRFIKPTYIGDTIHLELNVDDVNVKNPSQGVITAQMEVKKQTDEVVAAAQMKLLVKGKRKSLPSHT